MRSIYFMYCNIPIGQSIFRHQIVIFRTEWTDQINNKILIQWWDTKRTVRLHNNDSEGSEEAQ